MADVRERHTVSCRCGQVEMALQGSPILSAVCYCADCQEAGWQLDALGVAPSTLDEDFGSGFVLYRKDRFRITRGAELLREHRLKPDSPTRRVVADCCGAPLFLDFTGGHWVTLYRKPFGAEAPPLDMRIMTRTRPAGVAPAGDVPSYGTQPLRFIGKLMAAWLGMGFQTPKLPVYQPLRQRGPAATPG